jgi:phosphoribosylamine--glycine ligase
MSLSQNNCAGAALENFLMQHNRNGIELSAWLHELNIANHPLEGKKTLAYHLLSRQGIPIPQSKIFSNLDQLWDQLQRPYPFVVKFDTQNMLGLQTVIVNNELDCVTVWQHSEFIKSCSGIVQDFCQGREYTVTALVGQHNWISLGSAVDFKKVKDHNQGANTFGLGSLAPCNYVAAATYDIIDQVVFELQRKCRYQGVLSCQFLLDSSGHLWFLEYNTRFCDPEFQSMLPSLNVDLITSLEQLQNGTLISPVTHTPINAVTVGMIHQNWPIPQPQRALISLTHNKFDIIKMQGQWDYNTYWGSITNTGCASHQQLSQEIYNWLDTVDVAPYRYRKDIGK